MPYRGEPVLAAQAGRIVKRAHRAAGKFVAIQHPNGLTSFYNHMKTIDDTIKIGDYVFNGQAIGQVGCTGYCTQPHLHFPLKRKPIFKSNKICKKPFQFMAKTMLQEKLPQLEKKNYSLDKTLIAHFKGKIVRGANRNVVQTVGIITSI